jgi:plasmid maintenance system antidote protein VapI
MATRARKAAVGAGRDPSKLASDVKIPMSTISEVLNGKQQLTRKHIPIFSKYFGVSLAVFQP